jgi:hypothetical protein
LPLRSASGMIEANRNARRRQCGPFAGRLS